MDGNYRATLMLRIPRYREDRSRHLAAVAAVGGRLIILHRPG
jgi:hypothetical protein